MCRGSVFKGLIVDDIVCALLPFECPKQHHDRNHSDFADDVPFPKQARLEWHLFLRG